MRPILTLLLLTLSSWCMGQRAVEKLSPMLRQMVSANCRVRPFASPAAVQRAGGVVTDKRTVCVFLRIEGEDALRALDEVGGRVFDRRGSLLIAGIPVSRLLSIAQHPQIFRIEASPSATTLMDSTVLAIHALPVHQGLQLPRAFTGQGVMIGLMDIGFDLTHPNFFAPPIDGRVLRDTYRIRSLWDQLSPDTLHSSMPVGRVFEGTDELLSLGCSYDGREQDHGTHTLGSAAGSGFTTPWQGLAFGSDICLVANATNDNAHLIDSLQLPKFTTATDALGFKFLFDQAASRRQPCVVSFSEGYTVGFDDEDMLFREYIDSLVGPGRILVTSAGNESRSLTFLEKLRGTEAAGSDIMPWNSTGCYYVHGEGNFDVGLYTYNGAADTLWLPLRQLEVDSVAQLSFTLGSSGHSLQIRVQRYQSRFDLPLGRDVWQIFIQSDVDFKQLMPVAMLLQGADGHAYVRGSSSSSFYHRSVAPRRDAVAACNIMAPGCFKRVVTVGATTSRLSFVNVKGKTITNSTDTLGRLGYYSSVGPTIDGLLKPDVVAPGGYVFSSYSSFRLENDEKGNSTDYDVTHIDYNGRIYPWGGSAGTSMSTPTVAGTIALWLEAKPDLTPEDVKDIFSRTCTHPDPTLSYPNCRYGYGQIDAYAGLLDVLQLTAVEGLSHYHPARATVRLQGRHLLINIDGETCTAYGLRMWSVNGTSVLKQTGSPKVVDLSALPSGVYAVQIESADVNIRGSMLVRLD